MANVVLVIGKSGTGKSRSICTLNPAETVLINVNGKPLPFRGSAAWKKFEFVGGDPTQSEGSVIVRDTYDAISKAIAHIDKHRPEVKVGVIDDFQYVMGNEFMRRNKEVGFGKFTDIGTNVWNIIRECSWCRDDLTWIFLAHSDTNDHGEMKMKTIGKLLDEKICLEGMFTIVLNTAVERINDTTNYYFETQNNGASVSKSPEGMFEDFRIPNDLSLVVAAINDYYGADVTTPETETKTKTETKIKKEAA